MTRWDATGFEALLEEVRPWVAEQQRLARRTAPHGITDLAQATPHPRLELVACTATRRAEPETEARQQVLLVTSGEPRVVLDDLASRAPAWSPDGSRLCVLATAETGLQVPVLLDDDGAEIARLTGLSGSTESARWSADGSWLALVVADPGAEVSDVWGSGVVAGPSRDSWRPLTLPRHGGRRRLVVWDVASGTHTLLGDLNVWEADVLGADVLALVSEGASESDWYGARLVRLRLDGSVTETHTERFQLARPTAAPDGVSWSALTGLASDRDLLSGSLLVSRAGRPPQALATADTDVTDHRWVSDSVVLFIGHRGLDTVLGTVDVDHGTVEELWCGGETTGTYQPELGGLDHDGHPVLVLEHHHRPPRLVRLTGTGPQTLLTSDGPGTEHLAASVGTTRPVSWSSSDGLALQGLVDLPHSGRAPHPLVVHVHGGPVGAHQDGWIGRDPHTPILTSRGYAVFRPNPRGSTGRGADFAGRVLEDMGGSDVDDLMTGIDSLVASGLADATRVGVTGQSYGGFMAAWLPCLTDRFKASVSRSPCTDWRSFHLTSNLAEFARLFLEGDAFDPDSHYQTRNPLTQHHRVTTPMLLTAGSRDLATPSSQAQQMYAALAERGVPATLAIYPEEGHGVHAPPALADQCARMVAWFELFMPSDPGT